MINSGGIMERTASAVWRGGFKKESGDVSTSSGILSNVSPHDPARSTATSSHR
jgi:hypothetical protein